ncbi:MAG: hypothetical protein NZ874_04340 [Fimbriimonadales bacterium]|nr:hypothetical protein [Fimbriimonadales bacterium]
MFRYAPPHTAHKDTLLQGGSAKGAVCVLERSLQECSGTQAGYRGVGVAPTHLRHGHLAHASVARTGLSVPCLDTTVQATLVGEDADTTR